MFCVQLCLFFFFFFFNDTATTEIYTLSLHDALPISAGLPSASWSSERSRKVSMTLASFDGPLATGSIIQGAGSQRCTSAGFDLNARIRRLSRVDWTCFSPHAGAAAVSAATSNRRDLVLIGFP